MVVFDFIFAGLALFGAGLSIYNTIKAHKKEKVKFIATAVPAFIDISVETTENEFQVERNVANILVSITNLSSFNIYIKSLILESNDSSYSFEYPCKIIDIPPLGIGQKRILRSTDDIIDFKIFTHLKIITSTEHMIRIKLLEEKY